MFWLVPSLLNSFFDSVQNALGKHGAQKVDVLSAAWAQRFFALFIIIPLALINQSFKSFDSLNSTFWIAALISSSTAALTSILFIRAVKISPLSLTLPITTFTPVFLLITSPIIVGEFPKPLGVLGILSVVFGSYILNLSKRAHGALEPIVLLTYSLLAVIM